GETHRVVHCPIEPSLDASRRVRTREARYDACARKPHGSGNGTHQIEQMRNFVVEEAERQFLVPPRQAPERISELHGINATHPPKGAACNFGEEPFHGTSELEVMYNGEAAVLTFGGLDNVLSFFDRHRKGLF